LACCGCTGQLFGKPQIIEIPAVRGPMAGTAVPWFFFDSPASLPGDSGTSHGLQSPLADKPLIQRENQ
jgi:hypothetical protein